MRLVVREGARLAGAGLVLGTVVAAAAGQALRAQLFGVTPRDFVTYATAIGVIGVAALASSWLPARRASSVSPLEALRSE